MSSEAPETFRTRALTKPPRLEGPSASGERANRLGLQAAVAQAGEPMIGEFIARFNVDEAGRAGE